MSVLSKFRDYKGTQVKPVYSAPKVTVPVKKKVSADKTVDPSFKNTQTFGKIPTPTIRELPKPIAPVVSPATTITRDKGKPSIKEAVQRQNAKTASVEAKTEKQVKKTSKETAERLEKEMSDKYGINVKRANSPIEAVNMLSLVDDDQKEQFKKDFAKYSLATERSNPFRAGAEAGFNVLPTNLERTAGKEDVESAKGFGAGRLVGGIAQQGAFASVLGAPIEGLISKGLGAKAGTSLGKFAVEAGRDVLIGGGTSLAEAPFDKTTGTQLLGNVAFDIAINALMSKAGKVLSNIELPSAKTKDVVDQVATELGVSANEASVVIDNAIKAKTDFYAGSRGITDSLETAQAPLQLPDPKSNAKEQAFIQWRKDNFGGAFGRLSEADERAMRQLYLEDTGINTLPTQREVPRTVTPQQMTTPVVPKSVDAPIPVKAPVDVKPIPKPPKQQPVKMTVDELDAKYKQDVELIKSNVANKTLTPVEANKELTDIGKKYKSEKAKLTKTLSKEPIVATVKQTDEVSINPMAEKEVSTQAKFEPKIDTPMTDTSSAKFMGTVKKSEQTTPQLKERIKELELGTTTNEARLNAAKKLVDEDLEGSLNLVRSGETFSSDMEGAIGNIAYGKLQELGRYDDALDLIETLARKGRKSGQSIQMLSAWSKTTPEGMAAWTNRTLKEANVDVDPKFVAEISERVKNIQQATPEELAEILNKQIKNKQEAKFVEKFMKGESSEYLKELNIALTMKRVTDKLPIASARKLSTIQAMSHLLNARTFMRNILGNTASVALEQISNLPASGIDSLLSLTTKKRTLVAKMPRWKQSFTVGLNEGKKSAAEIMLGIHKVSEDKYDLFFESAFKGKTGKNLEKALSLSLTAPDEFFKGFIKSDSVYNQVRARLGKEVDSWDFGKILDSATPEEIALAVEEAKFGTFQNNSLPAKLLTSIKKAANTIGYGKESASGMKEFGLGDLLVKYTRVPGNLIARSIEYSPMGALKAINLMGNIPKNQRQIAQILGRAATGSTMMGVGYLLTKSGIIIPDKEMTYDEAALTRSEGLSGMKINVSAIGRLLKGEDTKLREGDKLKSYDWLQQINIPLAVGSAVSQMDGVEVSAEDVARAFAAKTMEQATDLPTMYTFKSMMYEAQDQDSDFLDIATVPVKEALPGFVPAVVRQTAQFIDPVIRDTKGKDSSETTKKKIVANIPFASKTLEPKLSPLGEEQVRERGPITTFVSPGTSSTYKPAAISEGLAEIKKLTGESSQYPARQAPKTIKFKAPFQEPVEIELTPKEKTLYQETFGAEIKRLYGTILTKDSYSTPAKARATYLKLGGAETEAKEKAKDAVFKARRLK